MFFFRLHTSKSKDRPGFRATAGRARSHVVERAFRQLVYGLFCLGFVLAGCTARAPLELAHYYETTTEKPYDEVLSELEVAITEHNFRITGHSRVGKVIREREGIDFPEYDTLQFCNLSHAKEMLTLAPDAVRHMPCTVVLYTRGDRVIIKTRLLPVDTGDPRLDKLSSEINDMLKEIVDFAAEE